MLVGSDGASGRSLRQAQRWEGTWAGLPQAVSAVDMDFPLPDEVLCCGGCLTYILGEPQDCREDRAAHLELQPCHGSFW